jgi:hypothetical protein
MATKATSKEMSRLQLLLEPEMQKTYETVLSQVFKNSI